MDNRTVSVKTGIHPGTLSKVISGQVKKPKTSKYNAVCIPLFCAEISELGYDYQKPTRKERDEIAQILDKEIVGWERHPSKSRTKRFSKYGIQKAWSKSVILDVDQVKGNNWNAALYRSRHTRQRV